MYILQNKRSKKYLRGYKANKPLWIRQKEQAGHYTAEDTEKLLQRLSCQCQFVKKIKI